jgi:hypothetical protein
MTPELEPIKQRYVHFYRANKTALAKLEKKYLARPTTDLALELAERRGFLRGLLKIVELFEVRQGDQFLPGID